MSRLLPALVLVFVLAPRSSHADTIVNRAVVLPPSASGETVPLDDWTQRDREGAAQWLGGGCSGERCRELTEEERTRYGILLSAAVRLLPPAPKGYVRAVPLSLGPARELSRLGRWREWTQQTRRSPELEGRGGAPGAAVFPSGRELGGGAVPLGLGIRAFYVPADAKPEAALARDRVMVLEVAFHPVETPLEALFDVPLAEVPFGMGATALLLPERGSGASTAGVRRAFWLGRPDESGAGRLLVAASVEGPVKESDKLFDKVSRTSLLALVGPVKSSDSRIAAGSARGSRPDTRFQETGERLEPEQRRFYGELLKRVMPLLPIPAKEDAKQLDNRTAVGSLDRRSALLGDAANLVPAEAIRCGTKLIPKEVSLVREFQAAGPAADAGSAAELSTPDLRITFKAVCGSVPARKEPGWSTRLDRWKIELAERLEDGGTGRLTAQLVFSGTKVPPDAKLAPVEHLVVTYEGSAGAVRELIGRVDREKLLGLLK